MKKTLLPLAVGASLSLLPVLATAQPQAPHLEVSGMGQVEATPDMADINIAVALTRPTAKEAKDASDKAIATLLQRLSEMGVAREDIKSANISLRAEYSYPKNQEPKLRGYHANRDVSVTVRDLNKLNTILDGALTDGLNRINGINLRSTQENKLKALARSKAIEDAINKGNALAKGFNQTISGVWKINYNSHSPRPYMRAMAAESAGNNMGYVDSKIDIRDQVNVVFTLNGDRVIYRPEE